MAKDEPGHYTESGTRKYQANGPVTWGKVFRAVAGRDGREGEGIRAALAYAAEHSEAFSRWAEQHPTLWTPARAGGEAKPAKAKPAKAKPAKAKPAKAKAKATKPAKAKAAKPAKAPEQMPLPATEAV